MDKNDSNKTCRRVVTATAARTASRAEVSICFILELRFCLVYIEVGVFIDVCVCVVYLQKSMLVKKIVRANRILVTFSVFWE